MTTSLPIGTAQDNSFQTVKKGDILQLDTGEKCTFLSMSRTRFSGIIDGKNYKIPVYRDKMGTKPFVTGIVGFDESVLASAVEHTDLVKGQLFSLSDKKETFMFVEIRGNNIIGVNIATGRPSRIRIGDFTLNVIDLDALKRKHA